ncbi:MAG: hypothetical protein WBG46_10485 [Nonlabens sp.]
MLKSPAFWKYYKDVTVFNAALCLFIGVITLSFAIGLACFCTVETLVGLFCFSYYYSDQYFMYYNLGMSKKALRLKVALINFIIAIPLVIIISLF